MKIFIRTNAKNYQGIICTVCKIKRNGQNFVSKLEEVVSKKLLSCINQQVDIFKQFQKKNMPPYGTRSWTENLTSLTQISVIRLSYQTG